MTRLGYENVLVFRMWTGPTKMFYKIMKIIGKEIAAGSCVEYEEYTRGTDILANITITRQDT